MAKYEAHITFDKAYENQVKELETELDGWQYSCINDDPIMDQKPYCYLTSYNRSEIMLLHLMNEVATMAQDCGIPVLRTKIERIIYDSKTGVNEIFFVVRQ